MIQENNTSDQNLQEEEEKKEKNSLKNEAIAFGGAAGVGACGAVVAEQVKEMELDLLKTTNEAGKPTGHGNMFENVVLRENAGARKINNLGSSSNPLLREKMELILDLPMEQTFKLNVATQQKRPYRVL